MSGVAELIPVMYGKRYKNAIKPYVVVVGSNAE
jgi:hypothetical protein